MSWDTDMERRQLACGHTWGVDLGSLPLTSRNPQANTARSSSPSCSGTFPGNPHANHNQMAIT